MSPLDGTKTALDCRNESFCVVLRSMDRCKEDHRKTTWLDDAQREKECSRLATENELFVFSRRDGDSTKRWRRLTVEDVKGLPWAIVARDRPPGAANSVKKLYEQGSKYLCPIKLRKTGYDRKHELRIIRNSLAVERGSNAPSLDSDDSSGLSELESETDSDAGIRDSVIEVESESDVVAQKRKELSNSDQIGPASKRRRALAEDTSPSRELSGGADGCLTPVAPAMALQDSVETAEQHSNAEALMRPSPAGIVKSSFGAVLETTAQIVEPPHRVVPSTRIDFAPRADPGIICEEIDHLPCDGLSYKDMEQSGFLLNDYDIRHRLTSLFIDVKSIAIKETRVAGKALEGIPCFNIRPSPMLFKLYALLFGSKTTNQRTIEAWSILENANMAAALIAAFLFAEVFDAAPNRTVGAGVDHVREALQDVGMLQDVEAYLMSLGSSTDTMLRKAFVRQLRRSGSEDHKAHCQAAELATVLRDHFYLADPAVSSDAVNREVLETAARVQSVIKEAHAIRCELALAKCTYEFVWTEAGMTLDPSFMIAINKPGGCGRVGTERVVALAMWPALVKHGNRSTETIFEGQVLLM